jgi:murein L,D-transpeptidase YafK
MMTRFFRGLMIVCAATLLSFAANAQDDVQAFRNFQMSFNRVSQAWLTYNDSLQKMFKRAGLAYPPKDIFIRSFKSHNEMELWARDKYDDKYKLVKTYRICALSGLLGPKRVEGDRQVPEGFYFIDDFNPKSDFFLSLLINYPNFSDMLAGDKKKPGGDIYIHGGCVTVGCLPMTDPLIQELYIICLQAKLNGQENIPVHIFPVRFNEVGLNFLGREYKEDQEKQKFWANLKIGYDFFERTHKVPPVMYGPDGKYIYSNL